MFLNGFNSSDNTQIGFDDAANNAGDGAPSGQPAAANPGSSPESSGTPSAGGANPNPQPTTFGPFKSADELNNGYKELQSTYTKTQQELKKLEAWKKEIESKLGGSNEAGTKRDVNKWLEKLATDPDAAVMEILQPQLQTLQSGTLKMQVDKTLDTLRAKHKDFTDFEPEMQALTDSGAFSSLDPQALEVLYGGLKWRKEMAAKAASSNNTPVPGTETPSGGGAPGSMQFSEEQLRKMSLADITKLAEQAK